VRNCNALSISSLRADWRSGAAMPGTGAAGIMPACPVMRTKPLINPYPAGQRRFSVALALLE